MKNKGFTLIELLGVVTILAMLGLIIVPTINKVVNDNKQKLYDVQIRNIENGASNFVADNVLNIDIPLGTSKGITLLRLKNLGYIDNDIVDPISKEKFDDSIVVIISNTVNGYQYKVCTASVVCESVSEL